MVKGDDDVRDWISLARAIEPDLASARKSDRSAVLDRAAALYGRKPSTLRRIVKAYRYIVTRAKASGLKLEQVTAPVVSVECLERLERECEGLDAEFRRMVLLGQIPSRELLAMEKQVREEERERREAVIEGIRGDQVDWTAFAIELSHELFGMERMSFAFGNNRKHYSQNAQNLLVDWEVNYEEEKIAVYLSPKIVFSECRGKTILDQLPRAVMACFYYDKVIYLAWDDAECDLIKGYINPAPSIAELNLKIYSFMSLPQGRVKGRFFRV